MNLDDNLSGRLASGPGAMRDLDVDDGFWRAVLEGLREGGGSLSALATRYPAYVDALLEIGDQAGEDSTLVGVRFAGEGRNARLLAFLSAALFAHRGQRAVLVDLSQELRWLERLVGLDLKQGLVDHVHYGVPLERCVRDTVFEGLAVLTGGARFLAGSPLEDAPAVRAALDRLKQHFQVVVMTLPASEPVSETGILALCDALIAVVSEEADIELLGRERLAVRVTGDPRAADDLAEVAHRFMGPLPGLFSAARGDRGGAGAAPTTTRSDPVVSGSRAAAASPRDVDDDVAFLSLFEESASVVSAVPRQTAERKRTALPSGSRVAAEREWPIRRRRRLVASIGLAIVVVGGMAIGAGLLPSLERQAGEGMPEAPVSEVAIDRSPIGFGSEAESAVGEVVPLAGDDAETREPSAVDRAPEEARPIPFSLHVGSYQSQQSAMQVAARIERAGMVAFVAPVALEDRGRWHRVYAGAFADSSAANATLSRLLREGFVEDGAVRSTPLTFLLGTYATREEAERRQAELRNRGIPAYVAGEGPARVYAGAFATREESRFLEASLHAVAEDAMLTTRLES